MPIEYRLTYSKVYDPDKPAAAATIIRLTLVGIMREYAKLKDWQARVPEAEIRDLRVEARTYFDENITPE